MTKKEFTAKLNEKHGKLNIQTSVRKEHGITITKFFVGSFYADKGFLKSPVHCGTWSVLGCSFNSDGSKF